MRAVEINLGGTRFRADLASPLDISIPLDFGGPQPNHFGAPPAIARPLSADGFVGDTRAGGSCNCEQYEFVPHCNGTHTECVGHVTEERVGIRDLATDILAPAALISLAPCYAAETAESATPAPRQGDRLLTASSLAAALSKLSAAGVEAVVVRTTPNSPAKLARRYDSSDAPPFFTCDAMEYLVQRGTRHLLVDTPSVDKMHDDGHLSGHRVFWGLPAGSRRFAAATRPTATITEMIFVPDDIADGVYLLNLQLPPFMTDAAPSRPYLYPLEKT